MLVDVVVSYLQTCHASPGGGGAHAVSRANLGENAALLEAAALLVGRSTSPSSGASSRWSRPTHVTS